ncbi:MAG: PAS domain S-box protein [Nostoc sp. TH1S01]|nr:PAS domain S-box protein [Nostoc sp. TH1S01]
MGSEANSNFSEQIELINQVLAASSDHIYISDRHQRYLYANPAGLAALGLQPAQLLGITWQELGFPAEVIAKYESVFQTGIPITGESSFSTVNGLRYYEYVISPIRGNNGEIEAVINTSRDITERQQTQDGLRFLAEELQATVTAKTQELAAISELLHLEISQCQKAQQACNESEMRFYALVDAMFEGMVIQQNGQIIVANSGFASMFGYTVEEIIGKSVVDFFTPESLEIVLNHIQNQYELSYEITGIKKDGTLIKLEVLDKPSFYQGQSVQVSAVRDITERKIAEAELTRLLKQLEIERSRLEQVLQQMPVGVVISEAPSGKLVFHNQEAIRILRHPLWDTNTYQEYTQYGAFYPDGQPYQAQDYPIARSLLLGEVVKAEEMHYLRGDSTWTMFSVSAAPILDQDGQIVATVTAFEDIWERKQAELKLAKEALRIQTLFDTSFDGIVILDQEGNVLDANPRFAQMLGYTPEEVAKLNLFDWDAQFTHEELQQMMQDYIHFKSGVIETRHRRQDGSIYDVEISTSVVEWEGEILRFCVCRDISERKQVQKELQQSEERYRALVHASSQIVWRTDPEGSTIAAPFGWEELTGQSAAACLGWGWLEVVHPEDRDRAAQIWQESYTNRSLYEIEYRLRMKNGNYRDFAVRGVPILDADGNISEWIGTCIDITERKQAEIALQERETTLRLFAQYAPAGIAMFDRDMRYVMASQRWVNDYNLDAIELLIGRSHYEIFPEISQQWRQIHQSCLAGASEKCDEDLFVRCDGTQQWIRWEIHPWYTAQAEIGGIIIFSEDITKDKQAAIALREHEQQLRLALQAAKAGAWTWDLNTNKLYWSEEYYRVFGLEPNGVEPSYENGFSRLHPEDREWVEIELAQAIEQGKNTNVEHRILLPDGTVRWVIGMSQMFYDETNCPERMAGILVDITERKQAEEELRKSEERFRCAILDAPLPIMLHTEDGEILQINHVWTEITGYSLEDIHTISDWIARAYDGSRQQQMLSKIQSLYQINSRVAEGEYTIKTSTGETRVWDFYSAPLGCLPDGRSLIISTAFDVTSRKQTELQLWQNAFYDGLTGLPNRALFVEHLKHALQQTKRHKDYLFAVLFLDLDRFKVINDSLGHLKGDQFLITIAHRLANCIRSIDTAARLGGDEFTILLVAIQDVSDAIKVAERIQQELSLPFRLDEQEVFTSASIGIALSSTLNYEHPEQLLRDADTAMYQAKALGKSRYALFNRDMYAGAMARLQLEADLRRAIQHQEFQLYYQPIVSLSSGYIIGFEALVRWQHPERGMVPPADFIPLAEETGLIVELGYWVLAEACRQMQAWLLSLPHHSLQKMSVNLSAKQFCQPNLIEQIRQILQSTKLNPKNLVLEITESVIVENGDEAVAILLQLRQLGIEISIDDFGTGYSSLGRLSSFPISVLKIDRSFIDPMTIDHRNLSIIEIIVTLAEKLGMSAIAEGVETQQQLAILKNLNCESVQGFFFSQPLHSLDAEVLLATNPHWD